MSLRVLRNGRGPTYERIQKRTGAAVAIPRTIVTSTPIVAPIETRIRLLLAHAGSRSNKSRVRLLALHAKVVGGLVVHRRAQSRSTPSGTSTSCAPSTGTSIGAAVSAGIDSPVSDGTAARKRGRVSYRGRGDVSTDGSSVRSGYNGSRCSNRCAASVASIAISAFVFGHRRDFE